jgi:nicotinate-nucleotide adenylyltransferase
MKLGMYGGAFDPPHNAHVALARAAVEQLGLDELRIVPTGHAWHRKRETTPAADRVEMSRIAFADVPCARIDEREVLRAGPTYTIDTLRELRAEHAATELFLVMGEDQAIAFTQWREWQGIAAMATLAMAARPDARSRATLAPTGMPEGVRIVRLQLPSMPESATDVREHAARGEDISLLVPPAVARYIASHHLYRGH